MPPLSFVNVSLRIGTLAPQSNIMRALRLCWSGFPLLELFGIPGPAPSQWSVTVTNFRFATTGSMHLCCFLCPEGLSSLDRFTIFQDTAGPLDDTADCNKSSWYGFVRDAS